MIALMVFDWIVTSGKSHREIQNLLNEKFRVNLKVDNNIGSATIAKINEVKDQKLLLLTIVCNVNYNNNEKDYIINGSKSLYRWLYSQN